MIKRLLLCAVAATAMASAATAATQQLKAEYGWNTTLPLENVAMTCTAQYGEYKLVANDFNVADYKGYRVEYSDATAGWQIKIEDADKGAGYLPIAEGSGKVERDFAEHTGIKGIVKYFEIQGTVANATITINKVFLIKKDGTEEQSLIGASNWGINVACANLYSPAVIYQGQYGGIKLLTEDGKDVSWNKADGEDLTFTFELNEPTPITLFIEMEAQGEGDGAYANIPVGATSGTLSLNAESAQTALANLYIKTDDANANNDLVNFKSFTLTTGAAQAETAGWYISGEFQGWSHAAEGYMFAKTATDGVYEFKTPQISGEFLIVWAETPGTPDWNKKIGGVKNIMPGTAYTYTDGGENFSMAGIVKDATVTLDTNAKTITVRGAEAENQYTDIYLVGDFGEGWSEDITSMPLKLKDGDTYTGTYTLTAATSYFKLKAGNFIYGTGGADVAVEIGKEYTTAKTGNAFSLEAGEYEFTYVMAKNADNGKLTVSKSAGIADIAADEANAPVEFFNLQGVRIANPAAGDIVIRRQGSKVQKVLVK